MKIKYPTKKQIDKVVEDYRNTLADELIGYSTDITRSIDVEGYVADYEKGINKAIIMIKQLNHPITTTKHNQPLLGRVNRD